jgi:hypothetical protein
MLFHIETRLGVKHTPIAIYEMETGRRIHRNTSKYKRSDGRENLCADDLTAIAPQVVDGKKRAPEFFLPLDDDGPPYVPTADELFERAIFLKFVEKDNFAMALARLEKINPKKEAQRNRLIQKRGRCRNMARSRSAPQRKSEVAKRARRPRRRQTKWRRRQTRRAKADWWLANLGFAVSE